MCVITENLFRLDLRVWQQHHLIGCDVQNRCRHIGSAFSTSAENADQVR
jgi:hypothetical protein